MRTGGMWAYRDPTDSQELVQAWETMRSKYGDALTDKVYARDPQLPEVRQDDGLRGNVWLFETRLSQP